MIKAIIFDCFGVLAINGWLHFKDKYFDDNRELLEQATEYNKRADAGLIPYEEFLETIAGLAKISPEETRKIIEDNPPNEKLFTFIASELRPKYKIGMLSNVASNRLSSMFSPEQLSMLDSTALSYEIGFVKPDLRAYQLIAQHLHVEPEECVFVDDQERYCAAAEDAGMQAIVYRDFEQCKQDLDTILSAG